MIESTIKTYLESQSGLTSLIADRIFYVSAPQDVETPYIVMTKVSDRLEQSLIGSSGLSTARIQFSIFAETYYDTRLISAQIQSALVGKVGTVSTHYISCVFDGEFDLYDSGAGLYQLAMDFIIKYN